MQVIIVILIHVLKMYYKILIFSIFVVLTVSAKRNLDPRLIYNLGSKLELQPNIRNVHIEEKSFIIGPNGGKIGLVAQDLTLSHFISEKSIKSLSEEMGISEEEYKIMVEKDLVEDFKQTRTECIYIRLYAQKL
jgi:hypothetical protein